MRIYAFACLIAAAGCYSPSAPSGGYECAADGACPSGLGCECGVCVKSADEAACSFAVSIDESTCAATDPSSGLCLVTEDQPFTINLEARKRDGSRSSYGGTARLASTWGHARASAPFTFVDGHASPQVTLDRATPGRTTAVLSATIGTAVGVSQQSLIVQPPPLALEPQPVLDTNSGWAKAGIGLPAIDRGPGGYTLYFTGAAGGMSKTSKIGAATSSDGNNWSVAANPVLASEQYHYFFPSVLRESDQVVRVFLSRSDAMNGATMADLALATSSDGGKTFGDVAPTLSLAQCLLCEKAGGSIQFPQALPDPRLPGAWLVYFLAAKAPGDGMGVLGAARSADQGATWFTDPVPTPSNGETLQLVIPYSASVVFDERDRIYRMWYGRIDKLGDNCSVAISYATSEDGQFYTGAAVDTSLKIEQVTWAAAHNPYQNLSPPVGVLPGSVQVGDGTSGARFTVWYSVIDNLPLGLGCAPVAIGRATRP